MKVTAFAPALALAALACALQPADSPESGHGLLFTSRMDDQRRGLP